MRVELPGGLERYLRLNRDRLLAQQLRNTVARRPLDEGFAASDVALFSIVEWISEANTFIATLMVVLEDLASLRSAEFSTATYLRYRLYLRSFFSEIGRARDRFRRFAKDLRRIGISIDVQEARANLERDLEHLLRGRNLALHEDLGKLRQEVYVEWSQLGLLGVVHPEAPHSNPEAFLRDALDSSIEPLREELVRCTQALSRALETVWIETERVVYDESTPTRHRSG